MDALPVPKKKWTLTEGNFNSLLGWLHPNREQAGKIYEEIRSSLIKGFRSHGCTVPEDLADETINRVTRKLPEFMQTYEGAPVKYFYRVAYYIYLEYQRGQPEMAPLPEDMSQHEVDEVNVELEYECLEECMQQLTPRNRELVSQYYQGEKSVKIRLRKELAEQLNTNLPMLRLQAHRIRVSLKKCIQNCMDKKAA